MMNCRCWRRWGPYTEEGIEIRDAAELRVKESDRIAALAENLRRMDAKVEERPDGLKVRDGTRGNYTARRLSRAEITASRWRLPWRDWQLRADRDSRCDCAGVSFPSFLQ